MAKKVTLDNLAGMIKRGFDGADKRFDGVDKRLFNLESGQEGINKRLASLEIGQEDIKLRLDNVVYRFELVELQKRVDQLEKIVLPRK